MINEIVTVGTCPTCDWSGQVGVQFKYGTVEGGLYKLGDKIEWFPIPERTVGDCSEVAVVLSGVARCPNCRTRLEFEVHVTDQTIVSVNADTGKFEYTEGDGHYCRIR